MSIRPRFYTLSQVARLLKLFHELAGELGEVIDITRPVGDKFAEIDAKLRRKGKPIPVNDVRVAATAVVRGSVLVTNDERFAQVSGLKTVNWIQ